MARVDIKRAWTLSVGLKRLWQDLASDGTYYAETVVAVNADGTSIGGGTQYTEGDTDASITGTAILWEDSANTLRPPSASKPLPVNMVSGSATVSGALPPMTSVIYDDAGNALTPKYKFVDVAASQSHSTVIAAVASHKIRVHQVIAVAAVATDLTFESNSAAISPLLSNNAHGGEVLPFSPMGWFETVSGEALKATTGAGGATGILVGYTEVP